MQIALDQTTITMIDPKLFRYALRKMGSQDIARDLVQETWLAALSSIESFAARASFSTWMTAILRRKMSEFRRKRKPQIEITQLQLTSEDSVEEQVEQSEMYAHAKKAFQLLSERERKAIELCDLQELERDQAAALMGVSREALRLLLHRGRNKLRAELKTEINHGE